MELVKDIIVVSSAAAREKGQLILEGEMIVPERGADMDSVLSASAQLRIEPGELADNRLSYKGSLDIDVLYLSKGEDKRLCSMSTEVPVNDYMQLDGVKSGMTARLDCRIANMDYRPVNDRKLGYKISGDIIASVTDKVEVQMVTDIEDEGCMQRKDKISYTHTANTFRDTIKIDEQLGISASRPSVNEVVALEPHLMNVESRCIDGGISISGDVICTFIYLGEDSKLPELYEFELPFSGTIEVSGAMQGMDCNAAVVIESCVYDILANDNGENRIVDLEIKLGVSGDVRSERTVDILEDAYSLANELKLDAVEVCFEHEVSHTKGQYPIKETVTLEEDDPDMLRILRASGVPYIDSVEVGNGKVDIEGVIDVDILYVTGDDLSPMYCAHSSVPFNQSIEARGASEDMQADVRADISHIGVNMLSDREAEIRLALNTDTVVTEYIKLPIIKDIEVLPPDLNRLDNIASITIYTVQKGDTLWKLAKRFNTTVDELVAANDIENPDLIYPGDRLIIFKRAM